ncbi:hypothetical protein [Zavarzinia sp.]|uniref:hypothetical protein n=1 Tax=Zavarzinia sp. TaxID=2027920 RepID=UPI003567BA11
MATEVAIMTFVSNAGGHGPGHSAVAVGDIAYTFENVGGGWLQSGSGWLAKNKADYMRANEHRPILLQYLNAKAVPGFIQEYVKKSSDNDDDYVGSGVCSTQVSKAVNYSLPEGVIFDPKGIDTPFGVFHCARRMQLVIREEYTWPGRGKIPVLAWASIVNTLKSDYPGVLDKLDISR